ncbi:DUF3892 domain-containing protein [Flavobacterium cerinum]|uniref:DUF3892 domain-containing protein n=1 Tax=Flavobacterium cerinum TaxID=2502784 RepID=A0ABY5ITS3_9FLAO|nr:DUF3892 domain-containing protein [Flavobacterium cerinum]UUC44764.1 DUF3892 domain-containing protein [Flavobacterium cerinum]
MAEYRITGVWKNGGEITHYAVHERVRNSTNDGYTIRHAIKMRKADVVALLETRGNTAKTYLWNYGSASWSAGADVTVVAGTPKFLRTTHDGSVKDNLLHLPDYGYVWNP